MTGARRVWEGLPDRDSLWDARGQGVMKRAVSGIHGSGIGGRATRRRGRTLVGALSLALLVFCGSAQAATFTVNNSGDAGDASLNGTCLTSGGVCTLRAAIQESNSSTPVADTIAFTAAAQPTINLNSRVAGHRRRADDHRSGRRFADGAPQRLACLPDLHDHR